MPASSRADAPESESSAPRSGIVWIASFPKSGNTWTRAFLHNLATLQAGEHESQDINRMNRFSTWEMNKKHYTELLGFEPKEEHRREIASVRHEVQRKIADARDGITFVKTHHALVTDRGSTTINTSVTSGAIYVVRNPLDVAISYAHHMNRSIAEAIDAMSVENTETPVTDLAVYEVYGSWSQHVWSWTRAPHPTIYVMRYEDMLGDSHRVFGGLAGHLRLDVSAAQVSEAIARSSFDRLRAQEAKDGFRERPASAVQFFREGKAGQWRQILSRPQIARIVRDHGEQMRRFGYLAADGTPV